MNKFFCYSDSRKTKLNGSGLGEQDEIYQRPNYGGFGSDGLEEFELGELDRIPNCRQVFVKTPAIATVDTFAQWNFLLPTIPWPHTFNQYLGLEDEFLVKALSAHIQSLIALQIGPDEFWSMLYSAYPGIDISLWDLTGLCLVGHLFQRIDQTQLIYFLNSQPEESQFRLRRLGDHGETTIGLLFAHDQQDKNWSCVVPHGWELLLPSGHTLRYDSGELIHTSRDRFWAAPHPTNALLFLRFAFAGVEGFAAYDNEKIESATRDYWLHDWATVWGEDYRPREYLELFDTTFGLDDSFAFDPNLEYTTQNFDSNFEFNPYFNFDTNTEFYGGFDSEYLLVPANSFNSEYPTASEGLNSIHSSGYDLFHKGDSFGSDFPPTYYDSFDSEYTLVQNDGFDSECTLVQNDSFDSERTLVQNDSFDSEHTLVQNDSFDSEHTLVQNDSFDSEHTLVQNDSFDSECTLVQNESFDSECTLVQNESLDSECTLVSSETSNSCNTRYDLTPQKCFSSHINFDPKKQTQTIPLVESGAEKIQDSKGQISEHDLTSPNKNNDEEYRLSSLFPSRIRKGHFGEREQNHDSSTGENDPKVCGLPSVYGNRDNGTEPNKTLVPENYNYFFGGQDQKSVDSEGMERKIYDYIFSAEENGIPGSFYQTFLKTPIPSGAGERKGAKRKYVDTSTRKESESSNDSGNLEKRTADANCCYHKVSPLDNHEPTDVSPLKRHKIWKPKPKRKNCEALEEPPNAKRQRSNSAVNPSRKRKLDADEDSGSQKRRHGSHDEPSIDALFPPGFFDELKQKGQKRLPNSFILYRMWMCRKSKGRKTSTIQMSRAAGQSWRILPPIEKQLWFERWSRLRTAQKILVPEFQYNAPRSNATKRRRQNAKEDPPLNKRIKLSVVDKRAPTEKSPPTGKPLAAGKPAAAAAAEKPPVVEKPLVVEKPPVAEKLPAAGDPKSPVLKNLLAVGPSKKRKIGQDYETKSIPPNPKQLETIEQQKELPREKRRKRYVRENKEREELGTLVDGSCGPEIKIFQYQPQKLLWKPKILAKTHKPSPTVPKAPEKKHSLIAPSLRVPGFEPEKQKPLAHKEQGNAGSAVVAPNQSPTHCPQDEDVLEAFYTHWDTMDDLTLDQILDLDTISKETIIPMSEI
ncbi:hypothetical protein TWF970_010974 [Orbilia oligospora]|uniref:HMG box domain-containing protein n=1 Tax=Orbilia oligospora TaxID=2813651 RepID=A0A7C8VJY9_ORBOL|nr:hypothetical protein TWF970_010974 [Orbilia oligospora]KAF3284685.1 hypothetical protein TWF970_010974 [Orbilia oligospora]